MKRTLLFSFLILAAIASAFSFSIDAGLGAGAGIWARAAGFSINPEVRVNFLPDDKKISFNAGAMFRYELTKVDAYSMSEYYGLGIAGIDIAIIDNLKLRVQTGVGGGYLKASGGEGSSMAGFVILPQAGLTYRIGSFSVFILGGGQITMLSNAVKTIAAVDAGVLYRIPLEKKGEK